MRCTLSLTLRIYFLSGQNGAFTPWSEPGECTRSCGGGIKFETRTCTNPKPSLNGADCDGVTSQLAPGESWCNIEVGVVEAVRGIYQRSREAERGGGVQMHTDITAPSNT